MNNAQQQRPLAFAAGILLAVAAVATVISRVAAEISPLVLLALWTLALLCLGLWARKSDPENVSRIKAVVSTVALLLATVGGLIVVWLVVVTALV